MTRRDRDHVALGGCAALTLEASLRGAWVMAAIAAAFTVAVWVTIKRAGYSR